MPYHSFYVERIMMNSVAIILVPFAFGGNPASASGPKCIKSIIKGNFAKFNDVKLISVEQSYDESAKDFLDRLKKEADEYIQIYQKIIVVGGNHLSMLPLYEKMYTLNSKIITLDAHRDFYPQEGINHASFLNCVYSDQCEHLLIGARDFDKHRHIHPNIRCEYIMSLKDIDDYFTGSKIDYLDIDLDVIDPLVFNWCGSAIEGGYSIEQVKEYILFAKQKSCKLYSVSEYIPNYDMDYKGAQIIVDLIKLMI